MVFFFFVLHVVLIVDPYTEYLKIAPLAWCSLIFQQNPHTKVFCFCGAAVAETTMEGTACMYLLCFLRISRGNITYGEVFRFLVKKERKKDEK